MGNNGFKVFGKFGFKLYGLLGAGMNKTKGYRVEALTLQALFRTLTAVQHLTKKRVADVFHVDADLVGAAGFQTAAQMGKTVVTGDNLVVGNSLASVFTHSHALSVDAVTAYGGVYGADLSFDTPINNTLIGTAQTVIRKLGGKVTVRIVVFCGYNKAACILIYAVDNAGALFAADARKTIAAVVKQGVYQSAVGVPGGGMDHHAPGLIYNDYILVLENNVKGDILRDKFCFLRLRNFHHKDFTGGSAVAFFYGRTTECNETLLNKTYGLRAGKLVNFLCKERVYALSALLRCYCVGVCH